MTARKKPRASSVRETFTPFEVTDYLKTERDMIGYLSACAEEGDPQFFLHALGNVAKASGIANLAEATGMSRMGLYKALSGEGNPTFATVSKIADALGFRFDVVAKN